MKFDLKNFSLPEFLRYFVVGLNFIVLSLVLPLLITSNIRWEHLTGKNSIGIIIFSIMAGYLIDSLKVYQLSWANIIRTVTRLGRNNTQANKNLFLKEKEPDNALFYEKSRKLFLDKFCSTMGFDINKKDTRSDDFEHKPKISKEEKSLLFSLSKRFASEHGYRELEEKQASWILNNHSCKVTLMSIIAWTLVAFCPVFNLPIINRFYLLVMVVSYIPLAIRFNTVSIQEKKKADTAFLNFAKTHSEDLSALIRKENEVDYYMPKVSAGGIVIGMNNKAQLCIAMVQRKVDFQWVFPNGGRIFEDRSLIDTAKREIGEKTSLKSEDYQFVEVLDAKSYFDDELHKEKVVKLFLGKLLLEKFPVLETNKNFNRAEWIDIEKIKPGTMHYSYQIEILETYKEKIKNINFQDTGT